MSITLMAYPTAFLINPTNAKGEVLAQALTKSHSSITNFVENLIEVKVVTNLKKENVPIFMSCISGCTKFDENTYILNGGLQVKWVAEESYCNVILSGASFQNVLKNEGEKFFNNLDSIVKSNVRNINDNEYFYYRYITNYFDIVVLEKELRKNHARNINKFSENELCASVNGKDVRFYRTNKNNCFIAELEQKIALVNIGIEDSFAEIEIKTGIKKGELENLLSFTIYAYDKNKSEINLNYANTLVKFDLQNGFYSLKFQSKHVAAVRRELEEMFVVMNRHAGRDLRVSNDKISANYTYKTNYMDKGVLINTLLEHGAKNLFEDGENVYCELYDMQMTYKRMNENLSYILEIFHVTDKNNCQEMINNLNNEYGLNIQEVTYRKILERLQKENMRLESEEVTEDNSIILTIDLG